MKIHYSLEPKADRKNSILTVGNFDGIHLGHQAMIKQIVKEAHQLHARSTIITFINHPAQVIRPHQCPLRITSNEQRIHLFKSLGLDDLYLLEFSEAFAGQTTLQFLEKLSETIIIKKIILGHDAAIGKSREGDLPHLIKLGKQLHFEVEDFPAISKESRVVSSTLVRQAINAGDFRLVSNYLGRPYSIYGKVIRGEGKGTTIGFPTANLNVNGLCLPPQGVYAVRVKVGEELFFGIANLGKAPTIKNSKDVKLEAHLFDYHENLYNTSIEVIFGEFIRPEIKFPSVEALKNQIKADIKTAQHLHTTSSPS